MDKVKESEQQFREGDWGVKYMFRGPKIDWGVISVPAGQCLGGHYHEETEETFYILEGQVTFYVNGAPHLLVAGDAVRLEPLEGHRVVNESDGPVKMVFIKCPYLPQDKFDV
ncbi:MAG: cupin domain-containing protein [Chloroflexi bacterium]|nr:cupin domain-containing protein [Chloroflexota bacterium]